MMANMRDCSRMMKKQQQNHQQNKKTPTKQTKPQKETKPQKPTTSEGHPGICLVSLGATQYSSTDSDSDIDIVH